MRSAPARKHHGPRRRLLSFAFFPALALRAVRGRIALAYLPAVLVLGAAWLFLRNNDLAARPALALSLFGLSLAVTAFIATAADILASRRPVWPWLRSLPLIGGRPGAGRRPSPRPARFSSRRRPRPPSPAVAGSRLHPRPGGLARDPRRRDHARGRRPAFRDARDGRRRGNDPVARSWPFVPTASFLLATATPVAFLLARNAERRLKPTLWVERHHSNAGDPLSWSAS